MLDETNPTSPGTQSVKALVTGTLNPQEAGGWQTEWIQQLARQAVEGLERAGMDVLFVDASERNVSEAELEGVDALLLLGGGDADPSCYGQEAAPGTYGVNSDADHFELEKIRKALKANMPILGICRGMQLINIAHGGDLVQDIGPGTIHLDTSNRSMMSTHEIKLTPNSLLSDIYGKRSLLICSGHHQAVGRLGEGLKISALADDGVIEAIESTERNWVIGVQWHPEDPNSSATDFDLLLESFAAAARTHKS